MSKIHLGSCLCGKIKFEITGSFESFYLCHCKRCQKDSGSAHGANLFSARAELKWLRGEEDVRVFVLPNTRHTKSFCSTCGSALPYVRVSENLLVAPAGCLDTAVRLRPDAHLFHSARAEWEHDLEGIKSFAELPTS